MAALTSLMTCLCAGGDSWLARSGTSDPGTSEVRDGNEKPRCNKSKRRNNEDNPDNTAVNGGFRGSQPGQRKKPFKGSRDGPSSLNKILDRLCQIHGTSDKPANHNNRECWVFKQAGKLNAKHKGRETPSEDEDEPRQPNTGGNKKFPPEVKTVNMIHVTKRRSKHALRDVCVVELVTPKFNPWSAYPITFDRRDHPTSIRHGGSAALVLDPIIDGYHLTESLWTATVVFI